MDDEEFLEVYERAKEELKEDLKEWTENGGTSEVHINWDQYQLIRKIYNLSKEKGYLEGFQDGVINGYEDAREDLNSHVYVASVQAYDEGFADGMNFGYNKAYNEIKSKEVSE